MVARGCSWLLVVQLAAAIGCCVAAAHYLLWMLLAAVSYHLLLQFAALSPHLSRTTRDAGQISSSFAGPKLNLHSPGAAEDPVVC